MKALLTCKLCENLNNAIFLKQNMYKCHIPIITNCIIQLDSLYIFFSKCRMEWKRWGQKCYPLNVGKFQAYLFSKPCSHKIFEHESILLLDKKQPIGTLYQINTLFWLDNLAVWVQKISQNFYEQWGLFMHGNTALK